MNPLQEAQAMIQSLLYRVADEQLDAPACVGLTLVFRGGHVMDYNFTLTRPGDKPLSITSDVDIEGEDDGP